MCRWPLKCTRNLILKIGPLPLAHCHAAKGRCTAAACPGLQAAELAWQLSWCVRTALRLRWRRATEATGSGHWRRVPAGRQRDSKAAADLNLLGSAAALRPGSALMAAAMAAGGSTDAYTRACHAHARRLSLRVEHQTRVPARTENADPCRASCMPGAARSHDCCLSARLRASVAQCDALHAADLWHT